ncbi:MAG: response regulator [Bdellovibrionales bacterium]|nr:response regulator [Bdellovibrionales bacterium]
MKKDLINKIKNIVTALVSPSVKITNEIESFRATMMSSLLLIYIALTLMTYYWLTLVLPLEEIEPMFFVMIVLVPLLFLLYLLSRTQYTKSVAWLWVVTLIIIIYYSALTTVNEARMIQILAYMGNVILISSFILSFLSTIIISLFCIVSLAIITKIEPSITALTGGWLVRYMIFLAFLGVLGGYLRDYFFRLSRSRALQDSTNASRNLFLASMSHEIRTPLMAIIGFSEIMKESYPNTKDFDVYVDRINENSNYLLQLVNNVIDLSRIDAGQVVVDKQLINLQDEIAKMVKYFTQRAQEKRLDLVLNIDPKVPKYIDTDAVKFRQILTNLLENAIKFTDRGVVKLKLTLQRNKTNVLNVEIVDQGCGINENEKSEIFNFFIRGESKNSKNKMGAGIGLALSRKLAQAMGGDILLKKTEVGMGSVFLFSLPLGKEQSKIIERKRLNVKNDEVLEGMKILVAEDSEDNRAFLNVVLQKKHVDLTMVEDGEKAIEKVRSEGPFDLIILDLQMPVMNGYEAVKKIRKQGMKGPIIALTAHALSQDRDRCLEAGFSDYLSKPVSPYELINKLHLHI